MVQRTSSEADSLGSLAAKSSTSTRWSAISADTFRLKDFVADCNSKHAKNIKNRVADGKKALLRTAKGDVSPRKPK